MIYFWMKDEKRYLRKNFRESGLTINSIGKGDLSNEIERTNDT